jgi:DNA-binding transcriptional regulator YiaG
MLAATLSFPMPLPIERLGSRRDIKAEIAEIRRIRTVLGLTQGQMAQLLDVSHATYYRWEGGKTPPPFMAVELMRAWAREEAAKKKPARKKQAGAK